MALPSPDCDVCPAGSHFSVAFMASLNFVDYKLFNFQCGIILAVSTILIILVPQ
jgi:hypothetical protein